MRTAWEAVGWSTVGGDGRSGWRSIELVRSGGVAGPAGALVGRHLRRPTVDADGRLVRRVSWPRSTCRLWRPRSRPGAAAATATATCCRCRTTTASSHELEFGEAGLPAAAAPAGRRPRRPSPGRRPPPAERQRGVGRPASAWRSSIQSSIRCPPGEQPVDPLLLAGRHLGGRHEPPPHLDLAVHRQLAPDVEHRDHVLDAGVRDEDDVGVAGLGQRRQDAAGLRRHHVLEPLGLLRLVDVALAPQPLDRPLAPVLGDVAALGEDDEGVVRRRGCGSARRPARRRGPPPRPGSGRMNRFGSRLSTHVDRRVPLQGVLEHDARLAGVPVQQRVHDEERVARAGVPAAGSAAAARRTTSAAGPRRRPARAAPAGTPRTAPAGTTSPARSAPAGSAATGSASRSRWPTHSANSTTQRDRLEQQVQQHHPEQPQRPPPAGQDRRRAPRRRAAAPAGR